MRLKAFALVLVTAGLGTSVAVASPPPGKGRGHDDGTASRELRKGQDPQERPDRGCRPRISLILKGVLVSVAADSLAIDVRRANRHGWALAGRRATVTVDARTKIRRLGKAELSDLAAGDRVKMQIRVCKTSTAEKLLLVAKRIVARPAGADAESERSPAAGR